MWSIETSVPQNPLWDLHWVDDCASFSVCGRPFLLQLGPLAQHPEGGKVGPSAILVTMAQTLRTWTLTEDMQGVEEAWLEVDTDSVPEGMQCLAVVRPFWQRNSGPVWRIVEHQWVPGEAEAT